MRSNYRKIGEFIHLVDVRNKHSEGHELLGLSITKEFIPSVANIVGTNMANYKIIKKGQFACSLMQVRRDKKIPVALQQDFDVAIISQAYFVFEIVNQEDLIPEYLMMWMSRAEFDRHACFLAVGGVRGSLEWEDFCDMELPVPSIEKQWEIVREYNTVNDRIALNKQVIQNLEDAAQSIYKQWFVDFEFPISKEYAINMGNPDLEGQPYKGSGGIMAYNKELAKNIPKNWSSGTYEECFLFKTGKLNSNAAVVNGKYHFFTCSAENYKTNTFSFDGQAVLLAGNNASAIYPLKYYEGKFDAYQRTYVIRPNKKDISLLQIYFSIKNELQGFKGVSSGTATKFLTMKILSPIRLVLASEECAKVVNKQLDTILNHLLILPKELELLEELRPILFAKMSQA